MMKSFVFLVVFLSVHFLVQGGVATSSDSVCNCCDQCDQSATVSKLLLGISNMLVDESANTTATSTTAPSTTTIISIPSTTAAPLQTNTDSSIQPSTPTHSSTTVTASTTATAFVEPSTTTYSPTTVTASAQSSTTTHSSTTATASAVTESSTKAENIAKNIATIADSYLTVNPLPTVPRSIAPIAVTSTRISVCPDNCYLDISGEFCNCFLPVETVRGNN
ncbi:hypothetical protein Bhyg_10688 [Pseudolycoriella hygida]|uniref:Uncharacterized protein n=1 Tax=Pseudolycoriella hygida TaxID=35572 RepID=A0A9Q0MTY7_9DIPT|nr:hypothetical protein Bhyg_10688 [Pseudolycoriella hygida]